jgi:hypothetical protein
VKRRFAKTSVCIVVAPYALKIKLIKEEYIMEENNFQKEIKSECDHTIEGLEKEIKDTKEFYGSLKEVGKIGSKVVIRNRCRPGFFAVMDEGEKYLLTFVTEDKQKLFDKIKENGWVLIE